MIKVMIVDRSRLNCSLIATTLQREQDIEVGTVKNHVHKVLQKLDVRNREEAAACWYGNARNSADLRDHPTS